MGSTNSPPSVTLAQPQNHMLTIELLHKVKDKKRKNYIFRVLYIMKPVTSTKCIFDFDDLKPTESHEHV